MRKESKAKAANSVISCVKVGDIGAITQDQWAEQKGF